MVPVAECNWPTVTVVSVTARPVVLAASAITPWLNTLAANRDNAAAPSARRRGRLDFTPADLCILSLL